MIKWFICLLAVGAFTYGNAFRSGTGQQMKPKLNCTEVGNGNFVYGCSKVFWMCSNGILYSQQCHSELFFDPVSNACEREENIELCNTQNSTDLHKPSKATEAFNCKGKVDSAYELAPCLYRFAHCKNGFVFYEGCPTGTVYDDNKKYCDWPANVAGCQDKERLSSRSPLDGETAAASPGYGPDDVPPPSIIHQQSAYGRQFKLGSSPVGASEQNDTLQYSSPTHSPPIQQQQPVGPPHTEHRQKQPQPPQQKQQQQQQKLSEQLSLKNEFDCTGKKDGTYPTPQNACATFFYKCSLNETYKYNCPHGLYFSTQKVHCEFLSKTPECNGHVLPYPTGPLAAPPANYTKIPVQASPYPPSNSNQQQSGASNINAKPALKVDFNCRDKADGFYAIGKCRNDYIRCVHKTSYLQECPKNFVFEADICEYMDECLKTVPPQSNGQQQVQSSLQLPQQPVVPAPPSQSYTFKQAQQRAINQTQNSYIHAPSTAVSSQSKQQDMPQKSSSSYDPQQPLYSQQQQSEGYLQNHRYTEVKPKPQSERIYAQPKSQTEGSHSQQTPPVAQIRDTFCQDKGLVHGYYSSGCSSYYFACVPRNTIKVPCPANLFYDSETEKCDYKTNVPACGGSRPSQQQPQSPPAYGQSNTQASLVVAHQQENQPSQQQQNSSVVTQPRPQSASPQLQQLYDDHNSQQDIIHKSANLRSFIQNSEVYQPIQSSIVQQQPAAPTPAPAWVPYSGQQQIRQPEIQRNQMPVQQPASNPAPAWVPYPSQQQQQQPAVPQLQVNYQPQQPLVQQPAATSQFQQPNIKNSYEKQNAPPKIMETFCRDNNLRDGFNGAGCAPYFFVCALGETTRLHCPTGLYYDEETHECSLKAKIIACGGQKQHPSSTLQQLQGSYGTSHSSVQQQPDVPEFDCQQKPDGVYAVGCSSKYFICNQKKVKTLYCPPGTYYSASTELCDYKTHIVECGGTAQNISPDSKHPVLIPQKPYPLQPLHQIQNHQQQPAVSNYKIQFNSKMKNAQGKPAKQLPLGAKYPPLQRLQQNPPASQATSPTTSALPEDDKCKNLSSGIYGSQCSKFFVVCIEKKSFDFMCPKDQAFNIAIVKCTPKSEIPACSEYRSASHQPAVHAPQAQQSYNHQQPQQLQQHASPRPQSQPLVQQAHNSPPVERNMHSQKPPVNNHAHNQAVVHQQPEVPTPAPAWVPYSGQQQIRQPEIQRNQMPAQQPASNPAPAWVPYTSQQQQPAVPQLQANYQPQQQLVQQPAATSWGSQPQLVQNDQVHPHSSTQQVASNAAHPQQSYPAPQSIVPQPNTPQHDVPQQSYAQQPTVPQHPPSPTAKLQHSQQSYEQNVHSGSQAPFNAQQHQSSSVHQDAPLTQQKY